MNDKGTRALRRQRRGHLFSWLVFGLAAMPVYAETSVVQSLTATPEHVTLSLSAPSPFHRAALPANPERGLPNRCYVDITPATLSGQVRSISTVDTPGVHRVRVSQFRPDTVRVVLDLTQAQPCWVTPLTAPDRLQITLGASPGSEVNTPLSATPPAQVPPSSQPARLTTTIPASDTTLPPQPQPSSLSPPLPTPAPPAHSELARNAADASAPSPVGGEETGPARVISLEDAYRAALANEEQIKIAGRELAKAQLLPWRAVVQLTPRADITGLYTRNKEELAFQFPTGVGGGAAGTSGSAIRPLEIWQGVFNVTQPILQPSFFPSRQLGKDSVQQSEHQYDFTVQTVLFGVAQAYYDVLRVQAQIDVARETLQLTMDQLRQARVRVRVGEVTETDALRAEVEVAQAEQTLTTTQYNRRLAATVLARAIGVQELVQVVEPTPPQYPAENYEQLLQKAYRQRQDLRAREFAVDIARQQKNLVLARYAPQIDTQWRFDRRDTETFAERDKFWTLFLNFRIPLFDGGVRELDLMEREENLGQAQLQVERLRKDISVEVQEALVALETSSVTLETLKKQVALAQRNYEITSKQYGVGEATSLDVNNTLNTLNLVRVRLTNQIYAHQLAILNLERVIGSFGQEYLPSR